MARAASRRYSSIEVGLPILAVSDALQEMRQLSGPRVTRDTQLRPTSIRKAEEGDADSSSYRVLCRAEEGADDTSSYQTVDRSDSVWETASTISASTAHHPECWCDCDPLQPGEHTRTFEPDEHGLGMLGDWGSGLITEVVEDGQAERLGVKRGWMMVSIREAPREEGSDLPEFKEYSKAELDQFFKKDGEGEVTPRVTRSFEVIFQDLRDERQWTNWGRDCCVCMCFCKGPIFQWCSRTDPTRSAELGRRKSFVDTGNNIQYCCGSGGVICAGMLGAASAFDIGAVFGNYSAVAVDGDELPKSPMYNRIPAAKSLSCRYTMKNLMLFPVHFHRSSALNRLTKLDMVSDQEKELLKTEGHMRHPVLNEPGNKPILNFIVWRRSSMFVLITTAVILDLFDISNTVIKAPQNQRDEEHAQVNLQTFHDWRQEHGDGFPDYIKHATQLMFNKCYSETAWIMSVKKHVQTCLKLLVLIPLFYANLRWLSWTKSSMWLRGVWLITFMMPFVTQSVPSRIVINFEDLIKGDVHLLKDEVTAHYNLNHTLRHTLELAASTCGKDPVGKFEDMIQNAAWAGSQAQESMKLLCGYSRLLDDSVIVKQFTHWHDKAQATVRKCEVAEESIEYARKNAHKKGPKVRMHIEDAKAGMKEVCSNVEQMVSNLERDEKQMSGKQGQIHDLAKLLVDEGLAALSESLDTLVGAINGIASFKSLWTAALSLGPGIIKGTMRAKSIVPEASLPGAFLVVLPWIYAPLAWSLFNVIVQIFGNWALLFATASFAFYPIVMSMVGMCFFISSPQRHSDLTDLMKILKRVEIAAVFCTALLAALWVYQAYSRINAAKDEHPILKSSLDFVMKESREAYESGKSWATDHILHFDVLDWITRHPIFALSCVLNTLEPVVSFYQKFLLTSMMSTDWILTRVSNERRFEFLAANRECLPYDASEADVKTLTKNRNKRLDALVIAFGGAVETAQDYDVDEERQKRAKK